MRAHSSGCRDSMLEASDRRIASQIAGGSGWQGYTGKPDACLLRVSSMGARQPGSSRARGNLTQTRSEMKKLIEKLKDIFIPKQRWIIKVRQTMRGDQWIAWASQERNNYLDHNADEIWAIEASMDAALHRVMLSLKEIEGRKNFEIWTEFSLGCGWKEFLS